MRLNKYPLTIKFNIINFFRYKSFSASLEYDESLRKLFEKLAGWHKTSPSKERFICGFKEIGKLFEKRLRIPVVLFLSRDIPVSQGSMFYLYLCLIN